MEMGEAGRGAHTPRVLFIDDDAALQDLVRQALALEGMEAAVAASPDQALALCEVGAPFSVVLLDWRLGQATGREFATAYNALPAPRAPIVLVTGAGDVVEHVEQIGARGFLKKPFDLEELIDVVQRFAEREAAPAGRPDGSGGSGETALRPLPAAQGGRGTTAAAAAGGPMETKTGANTDERQRRLRWMATEVGRIQGELRRLQEGVAALAEAEGEGRLTPAEQTQRRDLRLQMEALRLHLQELRAEFEALRGGRLN